MIPELIKAEVIATVESKIEYLTKKLDEHEGITCSCCASGEIRDDIEQLTEFKNYIKLFKL